MFVQPGYYSTVNSTCLAINKDLNISGSIFGRRQECGLLVQKNIHIRGGHTLPRLADEFEPDPSKNITPEHYMVSHTLLEI